MSQASQGPELAKQVDGPEQQEVIQTEEGGQIIVERRMSRELQVKLEALKLLPAQRAETEENIQQQTANVSRPASEVLRPPSTIPSSSRPSSALGTCQPEEVSTCFNNYHVVPMHNSTAQEHKQGSTHTTGLILPR